MSARLIPLRRRVAGWLASASDAVDAPPAAVPRTCIAAGILAPGAETGVSQSWTVMDWAVEVHGDRVIQVIDDGLVIAWPVAAARRIGSAMVTAADVVREDADGAP